LKNERGKKKTCINPKKRRTSRVKHKGEVQSVRKKTLLAHKKKEK